MISIIKSIDKYLCYINKINSIEKYADPLNNSSNDYLKITSKKDNITLLAHDGTNVKGIFAFLVLPNDYYVELLYALSDDRTAYEEVLDFLYKTYTDYDYYFVYNPKNDIMYTILKKEKADFFTVQKRMVCNEQTSFSTSHNVRKITINDIKQYSEIHNKDLYWTAERVLENKDFIIYISLDGNIVTGYADIYSSEKENYINDIFVLSKYQNKGYGKSILFEIINESYPKKISLDVDEDNYPARHIYEKMGFTYIEREDNLTAVINKRNKK